MYRADTEIKFKTLCVDNELLLSYNGHEIMVMNIGKKHLLSG